MFVNTPPLFSRAFRGKATLRRVRDLALKPRSKIRHSQPLEGEDARRFVEDVDRREATEKQRGFRAQSKGAFRKVFSARPANDLFPK
jgi:hypothetical protein